MKICIFMIFFSPFVYANNILGTWQFTEYNYDGNTLPAPNPNLKLRFTFDDKGTSLLKWYRTDEEGFCERKAEYSTRNDRQLLQKVVWINPKNHISCAKDPDMQLGKETVTAYHVNDRKLFFELELNSKPFFYILSAVLKTF